MSDNVFRFHLTFKGSHESEMEEPDKITRELADDLATIDGILSVEPLVIESQPQGSKGATIDWNTLLIVFTQVKEMFPTLSALLTTWLSREKGRSLELTIGASSLKLTGISENEQQALVEWFKLQTGLRLDR